MVGSSMLVDKLRVMLCFELFLNSKFYASYPFLQHFFEKNKEQFIKLSPVLSYTASHSTFDSINQEFGRLEFGNEEFEAIHLCEDRVWCSFLSVLSLSSVLKKNVHLHYPDFGPKKYRLLWNSIISPRQSYDDCKSKSFLNY